MVVEEVVEVVEEVVEVEVEVAEVEVEAAQVGAAAQVVAEPVEVGAVVVEAEAAGPAVAVRVVAEPVAEAAGFRSRRRSRWDRERSPRWLCVSPRCPRSHLIRPRPRGNPGGRTKCRETAAEPWIQESECRPGRGRHRLG